MITRKATSKQTCKGCVYGEEGPICKRPDDAPLCWDDEDNDYIFVEEDNEAYHD